MRFSEYLKEASDDAHFARQSPKMQSAINLHLRKGKSYKDAVAAAQKHVKEEVELSEEKVSKHKDLGATKDTKHFVKNMTTGEVISPHRTRADANEGLRAAEADGEHGHKFKIVRAVHEEVISEGAYEKAEEHLSKANDADAKGDKKAFHAHMADHHDAMSEWHDSKGRSASADKHAEKADYHHEKSLSESYDDNRHGFAKRHREDDEYHNGPDPVKHTFVHTVSKEGGEKHQRTVTTGLTTRPKHEFEHLARQHLEKQGYKIHESTELEEATPYYNKPSFLKKMGNVAKQERLAREKKEKEKKEVKEETTLDEVKMTAAMKLQRAFQREQEKTARERKAGEDLLKKNEPKKTNEETEVCPTCNRNPCWCDDSHGFVEGLKPEHKMRPGWMLKADPVLAKKVADNKKKYKSFKDTVGKKIETK